MKNHNWKVWIENKKECRLRLDIYIKKSILKKSGDESKLYLRKADHNLNFANWVFDKHNDEIPKVFGNETFYDWIINAYYYSIYHAALALVSREGHNSKNHSATLCFLIYYNYHMQNAIDKEDIELVASSLEKEDIEVIAGSKELRERASYDIHELFERGLAEQIRIKTADFTNKIKALLKEDKRK